MMHYSSRIHDREPQAAGKMTLGLLTLIVVAVFLALTFGEAEGVIGLFR